MKLAFSQGIFEKSSNTKFHENASSGNRDVTHVPKDGHGEGNCRFPRFRERLKMVMNFQKGSCLELKAFIDLKWDKCKNTEMHCWTPLELGAIILQWKHPFRFRTEYFLIFLILALPSFRLLLHPFITYISLPTFSVAIIILTCILILKKTVLHKELQTLMARC